MSSSLFEWIAAGEHNIQPRVEVAQRSQIMPVYDKGLQLIDPLRALERMKGKILRVAVECD